MHPFEMNISFGSIAATSCLQSIHSHSSQPDKLISGLSWCSCQQISQKSGVIFLLVQPAVIHSTVGLNITTIKDLYHLCHNLELTNVRLQSDSLINIVIGESLAREAVIVKNKTMTEALERVPPLLPPVSPSPSLSKASHTRKVKNMVKNSEGSSHDKGQCPHQLSGPSGGPSLSSSEGEDKPWMVVHVILPQKGDC